MRAVIQRVQKTSLSVNGDKIAEIPFGLAVYLGISSCDTEQNAIKMVQKITQLRIFEDDQNKMNRSVKDVCGEILLISQFTLYGDCAHGNRPSFSAAARPEQARTLYEYVLHLIQKTGIPLQSGFFGADMQIDQQNDGPVTIVFEC